MIKGITVLASMLLALTLPAVAAAGHGGDHLSVPAATISGSSVVVSWRGTPGNAQDWVTVVKSGTPDKEWAQWTYTKGAKAGSFTVKGLVTGRYEARLYYNWPDGGFEVIERVAFSVKTGAPTGDYLSLSAGTFEAHTPVVVTWARTPGNQQDWITVVKAGTSDEKWGTWIYLEGARKGEMKVPGLAAGDYEARLYFDWPKGGFKVIERLPFTVR